MTSGHGARACRHCGAAFEARTAWHVHCCKRCRNEEHRARDAKRALHDPMHAKAREQAAERGRDMNRAWYRRVMADPERHAEYLRKNRERRARRRAAEAGCLL